MFPPAAKPLDRERQFRAVFFDAADAMLILDDERVVIEANSSACVLFGIAAGGDAGVSLDDLCTGVGEPLDAAWREMLALGEARREHRVRSRTDGENGPRLVECSYRARVHGQCHLCIARDITDRRLMEERLIQSEKIETVGRLAGGIAHDFNNLLTAILGYTELLLGDRPEEDRDRHDLEEIEKAAQRAAALTQQLLAFSRKQVLMPRDVDLNQTVAALQTMLARLLRADITLSCSFSDAPAIVRIDATQIEQALLNLALNARDALPAGGEIRVEVSRTSRGDVPAPLELSGHRGDLVRVSVSDNGVGLSAEARAHLFEPFFTTKEVGKGTGLGLASVYGIVRQSNGFIHVETEPGAGSRFIMHFPAVDAALDAGPAAAPGGMLGTPRGTVLLVEDEDAVRVIISAILRRHGFNVVEASGARIAGEIFAQRSDIELLLTDVVMPDMSGPALAQRLIGMRPELRVLFISGYADKLTVPGGDTANIEYLSKPFQASVLTSRVARMLAQPGRIGGK
jgi:PAS domain S-box-containing protein